MTRSKIRIATRASALALWQARWVATRLAGAGHASELVEVTTAGDASSAPLRELGVGIFVKGVQDAVRDGRADLAVHSFKDLPAAPAAGLEIAAVPERAAAHDVMLLHPRVLDAAHGALPVAAGARIGTGAVRRVAQLAALRPDLRTADVRGNVPTRVAKLRAGDFDGLMLAAAGLDRLELDLTGLQRVDLDPAVFLPAPAQGALALEIRRGDPLGDALTDLHDVRGYPPIAAERGLLALLDAGCQLALGAHARRDGADVVLDAWFEGRRAQGRHATGEGAAMFAFENLGRPRHGAAVGAP
ncbi:MAG: hydroxymethylbilane synthase [Trueperaceae bacterium]